MRRWIAPPLKKRQPKPEPLIRRCDHLGVANTRIEGTYEWIMTPDPRPKIELHLIRADDEPSTLTLIAKKMYEWNRMTWKEQSQSPKEMKTKPPQNIPDSGAQMATDIDYAFLAFIAPANYG